LRYLTTSPEAGLSQAVQKVRGAAQSYDKKTEKSYRPILTFNHRVTASFYAWFAAVSKANGYLLPCDSDNFTKQ